MDRAMAEPRDAFFLNRARDCSALARSSSNADERVALMTLRTWYLQQLGLDGARRVIGTQVPKARSVTLPPGRGSQLGEDACDPKGAFLLVDDEPKILSAPLLPFCRSEC
jgi:hypothetical protein